MSEKQKKRRHRSEKPRRPKSHRRHGEKRTVSIQTETAIRKSSNTAQKTNHKRKDSKATRKTKHSAVVRMIKYAAVGLAFLLFGAVCYGTKLFVDANNLLDSAYKPLNKDKQQNTSEDTDSVKDPISILVLGIDDNEDRQLGSARTDSMILLTLNPEQSAISMVSIPRDTYTSIETEKFTGMDKINSAYTHGENEGAIKAVESLMNVPINYYLTVDFQAFEEIVNALGGVDIDVPFDINESYASDNSGKTIVPKGKHLLTGEQALAFARVRKVDNDVERGKRQQVVIQSVIQKATEIGSVSKYTNVMKALQDHMWTNMHSKTMLSLAKTGLSKSYTFNSYAFDWHSFDYTYNDGSVASMVALYADSLDYISHKFRLSLNLDQPDERDAAEFVFQTNGVISDKTYPYTISGQGNAETPSASQYSESENSYQDYNNNNNYNDYDSTNNYGNTYNNGGYSNTYDNGYNNNYSDNTNNYNNYDTSYQNDGYY